MLGPYLNFSTYTLKNVCLQLICLNWLLHKQEFDTDFLKAIYVFLINNHCCFTMKMQISWILCIPCTLITDPILYQECKSFVKKQMSQWFLYIHTALWTSVSQKTVFEGNIGEKKRSLLDRTKRARSWGEVGISRIVKEILKTNMRIFNFLINVTPDSSDFLLYWSNPSSKDSKVWFATGTPDRQDDICQFCHHCH